MRALLESPPEPAEAGVFKKVSSLFITAVQKKQKAFFTSTSMVAINIDGLQVRSVYHACMNEPLIEEIGLQPLKDKLRSMGGWPVLEVNLRLHCNCQCWQCHGCFYKSRLQGNDWNEEDFSWIDTTYKFRENSYSTDLLIDFSIGTEIKNSSWRVIDIDQAIIQPVTAL